MDHLPPPRATTPESENQDRERGDTLLRSAAAVGALCIVAFECSHLTLYTGSIPAWAEAGALVAAAVAQDQPELAPDVHEARPPAAS
jgi:hypothetical protein